ncbi:NAD(P)/FAD-dependent oxidoreductase [Motilibacter aurantiacus]|uniref:NAD(P)/FAD-dependent oxidoreductase n=1 Tax=Motilibacter aurantiacus TaxID=2714955 RepID=UPI00140CE6CA|nr:FAD-dependent oxidoreductase [Motilibacter aurantiacus]
MPPPALPTPYDVVVVGAGIVGAACALALARHGARVAVIDRGPLLSGTTGSGEGNVLVSDKGPGPELDLALLSNRTWRELGEELQERYGGFELEPKGGLVVARDAPARQSLAALAAAQAAAGVEVELVPGERLGELEPHLAPGLAGGAYYPQDAQLQPARAAAVLLRAARDRGAHVRTRTPVVGVTRSRAGAVTGVETRSGRVAAAWVVNAAGAWAGDVAGLAGAPTPVAPRRGFILVTEPLPVLVRHKVYSAGYLADVATGDAGLQASTVVEGTPSGPVLVGATRELVGFDRTVDVTALRALAAGAAGLFPVLAGVRVMRAYAGFRPFSPDHLPVIGPDPRVPGLVHAHGHEGAGIGLAAATGLLVAEAVLGAPASLDLAPFTPARFDRATVPEAGRAAG